jgi:predicted DNA-binding transcriptional regulator AlpA
LSKTTSQIDLSTGHYSISYCAKRLGKTPQTIYRWIKIGQFAPVIKVGAYSYKVKAQDFEDWISSFVKEYSVE